MKRRLVCHRGNAKVSPEQRMGIDSWARLGWRVKQRPRDVRHIELRGGQTGRADTRTPGSIAPTTRRTPNPPVLNFRFGGRQDTSDCVTRHITYGRQYERLNIF